MRTLLAAVLCGATAYAAEPVLRIAVNTTTIESTPLFLAAALPGANLQLVPVTNGRMAMTQLLGGEVDAATGSETQLLLNSVAQPGLRAILTLAECRYRIVARRSSGIRRLADLKGKKIAATAGTSSLYFLDRMLRTVKLSAADVQVVAMEGQAMPAALASRAVDAVAIWEPHAQNSLVAVGADVITFADESAYTERFNLNTTTAVLADSAKRRAFVELIRNLQRASDDIRNRPADARRLSSPLLSIPEGTMAAVWPFFRFPADLRRANILTVLGQVEPWAATSQNRPARSRSQLETLLQSLN